MALNFFMDILEILIQKDIDKDSIHYGTFTDEDIEKFKKEFLKPKNVSLFDD